MEKLSSFFIKHSLTGATIRSGLTDKISSVLHFMLSCIFQNKLQLVDLKTIYPHRFTHGLFRGRKMECHKHLRHSGKVQLLSVCQT